MVFAFQFFLWILWISESIFPNQKNYMLSVCWSYIVELILAVIYFIAVLVILAFKFRKNVNRLSKLKLEESGKVVVFYTTLHWDRRGKYFAHTQDLLVRLLKLFLQQDKRWWEQTSFGWQRHYLLSRGIASLWPWRYSQTFMLLCRFIKMHLIYTHDYGYKRTNPSYLLYLQWIFTNNHKSFDKIWLMFGLLVSNHTLQHEICFLVFKPNLKRQFLLFL